MIFVIVIKTIIFFKTTIYFVTTSEAYVALK
jgi:hypothetical protein